MQQHLSDCWQSARLWMVVVQSSQQQRCCATSNRRQLVIFTAIQCMSAMTKYCTKNISCYNKKFWDWKVFQKHILTTAETYDTNNTVHQQHLAYFHKITAVSILNTFQHHAHPCLQAHMCQPTGLLQHCRAFDPLPFMTSPMTWMDLSRNQAGSSEYVHHFNLLLPTNYHKTTNWTKHLFIYNNEICVPLTDYSCY